jgi:hypothetical protein
VKKWILLILLILGFAAIAGTLYLLALPLGYHFVIPMSLGNVNLYSGNSTFVFEVYNPGGDVPTTVNSVLVNGTTCNNSQWKPIPPNNGDSISYVAESCTPLHLRVISGDAYNFSVSFSNGVIISGSVQAS